MLYVDTKDLTGTALEELAKQVSVMGVYVCKYLNKNGHSYKERVRIAETIPLYYLDLAKVAEPDCKIVSAVKEGGYYHQIKIGDEGNYKPSAYALSSPDKNNKLHVDCFSKAKDEYSYFEYGRQTKGTELNLPAAIEASIKFTEERVGNLGDSKLEVRLLKIPELNLYAFWLLKENGETEKLKFVDVCLYKREIDCYQFYTEVHFLDILRHLTPVLGLLTKDIAKI